MTLLAHRRILLGVSGGIAAYKTPELTRRLIDAGADVRVILTDAATQFVTPLALEVVSTHPVGTSLWSTDRAQDPGSSRINHTDIGKDADLILLAPATADLIAKIRHGLADDLLTTAILACNTPVLLAPSMNTNMLLNPITQANLAALQAPEMRGRYTILQPGSGLLACGITGPGRLPDPPVLIAAAAATLTPNTLSGTRITLSAGPTQEPLDPVRFLTNHSTGTMGFALARALAAHGADVTLLAGPRTPTDTPVGIARRIDYTTAADLAAAVDTTWPDTDVLVMTAAVADYRPRNTATTKLAKTTTPLDNIPLERTTDVLATAAARADRATKILVGFAAETGDIAPKAHAKLARKDLDFIVANDVATPGTGFGTADNAGLLIARDGSEHPLPRAPKEDFATHLANLLAPALARKAAHP